MPTLPTDGQTGWGDILNAYITNLNNAENSTQSSLNSHTANSPADPHGDRAYASSLVSPITSGVNGPNGYVKANSSGVVPASLIYSAVTGGAFNKVYDAVAMYGATAGTGSDQSTAINNALGAASAAGGGIVYIGPGIFSIANTLVIGSNTWLMMTPTTVLKRITGSPNASYMISNIAINSSSSPGANIFITGGQIDSLGSGVTSNCTNIFFFQAANSVIRDVRFNSPRAAGPAVELNGCAYVTLDNLLFDGVTGTSVYDMPAVRLNTSSASTSPAGLNSSLYTAVQCRAVTIRSCHNTLPASNKGCFSALVANDLLDASAGAHFGITIMGNTTRYASFYSGVATVTNTAGPVVVNLNGPQWSNVSVLGNNWFDYQPTPWATISLTGSFTTPGSNLSYPLQVRLTSEGKVEVVGSLELPSSYNNVTFATMPSGIPLPTNDTFYTAITVNSGTWSQSPSVRLYGSASPTAGQMRLFGIPSGLNGDNVFFKFEYPLDQTGMILSSGGNPISLLAAL